MISTICRPFVVIVIKPKPKPTADGPVFEMCGLGEGLNDRARLVCSPPGTGKGHLVQGVGYPLIKLDYLVLYRWLLATIQKPRFRRFTGPAKAWSSQAKTQVFLRRILALRMRVRFPLNGGFVNR